MGGALEVSLADRLVDAPRGSRSVCRVAFILAQLDEADREALKQALAVPVGHPDRITNVGITEALNAEGFPIHAKTVETHRKGACRCEPGK